MRRAGCRLQDKCQQSTCSVCTMYVHGIVASEKCRASEEGGDAGKVYRAGARAVGQRQASAKRIQSVYNVRTWEDRSQEVEGQRRRR